MVRVQRVLELCVERPVHLAVLLRDEVHRVDASAVAGPAPFAEASDEFAVAIICALFLGRVCLVVEQRNDVVQFAAADGKSGGVVGSLALDMVAPESSRRAGS